MVSHCDISVLRAHSITRTLAAASISIGINGRRRGNGGVVGFRCEFASQDLGPALEGCAYAGPGGRADVERLHAWHVYGGRGREHRDVALYFVLCYFVDFGIFRELGEFGEVAQFAVETRLRGGWVGKWWQRWRFRL